MEGFVSLRVSPWVRRLVTRLLAVVPAVAVILARGGGGVNQLLVLSQVVLALQLPFAMFPLLVFTGRRSVMGRWASGPWLTAAGWGGALLITAMDLYGLPGALSEVRQVFS